MLWRTNVKQRQIRDSSPIRSATVPKVNGDRSNAIKCVNEVFGKINKSITNRVFVEASAPVDFHLLQKVNDDGFRSEKFRRGDSASGGNQAPDRHM